MGWVSCASLRCKKCEKLKFRWASIARHGFATDTGANLRTLKGGDLGGCQKSLFHIFVLHVLVFNILNQYYWYTFPRFSSARSEEKLKVKSEAKFQLWSGPSYCRTYVIGKYCQVPEVRPRSKWRGEEIARKLKKENYSREILQVEVWRKDLKGINIARKILEGEVRRKKLKKRKGRVRSCFLDDRMAGGVILAGESCFMYTNISPKKFLDDTFVKIALTKTLFLTGFSSSTSLHFGIY